MQVALHHQFGREPLFVLNAFALGPWATGMNVSMSVVDIAILKSVGPDIGKLQSTLALFGPRYRYLIAGYPPFLKSFVDTADMDWARVRRHCRIRRRRDERGHARATSSASSGGCTARTAPPTSRSTSPRRATSRSRCGASSCERPELRRRLRRVESTDLPMVFQYNPIDYYVETNDVGELVVTLCRTRNAAPKIRYNIRDLGHIVRHPELRAILHEESVRLEDLAPRSSDLPFLFLYGRADDAVAYYGCKVTPGERAGRRLLGGRAPGDGGFVRARGHGGRRERTSGSRSPSSSARARLTPAADAEELRQRVLGRLAELNQDYREAQRFMPVEARPTLEWHAHGTGPFAGADIRLKRHYVHRLAD